MRTLTVVYPKSVGRELFSLLLVVLFILSLSGCASSSTIVNNLTEQEANQIVVYLATKGINATKVQSASGGAGGGQKEALYSISVPADQRIEAMSLLNEAGLPRRPSENLLNIFKESGLVPSEMTQKIRYQQGLAEQIASTIRKIDGVLDAQVQISFPQTNPLTGKPEGQITASVFVKHNGVLDNPNSHLITKIKRLVAASVTGLNYDNVTVIPVRASYAEFASGLKSAKEEQKHYVKTWGLIIAKESLSGFRLIFFSFFIIIIILFLMMCWIGWKVFPVLKAHGGFGSLFTLSPLAEAPEKEEEEKGEEGEEGKEEEEEEEEKEDEEEGPPKDVT